MDHQSCQKSHRENRNDEECEAEAVIIGGMVLDIHATPSIHPNPRTTSPGKVQYAAGGVARNIAECVSKLGTKPYMISALGSDMPGNLLLEYWKSAGLSLEGIRMGNEIETPVVCIVFDTEGEPAAGVASVESLVMDYGLSLRVEGVELGFKFGLIRDQRLNPTHFNPYPLPTLPFCHL